MKKQKKKEKNVTDDQFWSAVHRRFDNVSDENEEKILKKVCRNYVGGTWVVA